jgi:hypothetical protein
MVSLQAGREPDYEDGTGCSETFIHNPARCVHSGNVVNDPRWAKHFKQATRREVCCTETPGLRGLSSEIFETKTLRNFLHFPTFVHSSQKPSNYDLRRQNFRTDLLAFATLLVSGQAPSLTFEIIHSYNTEHEHVSSSSASSMRYLGVLQSPAVMSHSLEFLPL